MTISHRTYYKCDSILDKIETRFVSHVIMICFKVLLIFIKQRYITLTYTGVLARVMTIRETCSTTNKSVINIAVNTV